MTQPVSPFLTDAPPPAPDTPRLSIVIPAYNEARTIRQIVDRIAQVDFSRAGCMAVSLEKEIILVDDGSTDATPHIIEDMFAEEQASPRFARMVVLHKPRGGKGSALKAGIREAQGDIILFQDADLECDPFDYPRLLRHLVSGDVNAVISSRFLTDQPYWLKGTGNPVYLTNHIGVRFLTWLTNRLYRHQATDYAACYKAFRAPLLKSFLIEANGFDYEHELICKLLRRRVPVREVPVRYAPRSYADGKKITWRDGLAMGWTVLKWRIKPMANGVSRPKPVVRARRLSPRLSPRLNGLAALKPVLSQQTVD